MKNNRGFSLVELIVVIAIMAILAAVAVASFSIYIERANDAADFEYLSNLMYLAELFAIENQLDLDSVIVSEQGVSCPEDIVLLITIPGQDDNRILTGDKIKEIYDAVGNWEFKGEGFKDVIDIKPGENDDNHVNEGDKDCDHADCDITYRAPTCKHSGYEKRSCKSCTYEQVFVYDATGVHDYSDPPKHVGNYYYYVCATNGCSQVKITGKDGSIIVPID